MEERPIKANSEVPELYQFWKTEYSNTFRWSILMYIGLARKVYLSPFYNFLFFVVQFLKFLCVFCNFFWKLFSNCEARRRFFIMLVVMLQQKLWHLLRMARQTLFRRSIVVSIGTITVGFFSGGERLSSNSKYNMEREEFIAQEQSSVWKITKRKGTWG